MTKLFQLSKESLNDSEKEYFREKASDGFKVTAKGHLCYVGNVFLCIKMLKPSILRELEKKL